MMVDPESYLASAKENVAQDPENPGSWNLLGQAYKFKEEYTDALKCLEKALGLNLHSNLAYSIDSEIITWCHFVDIHERLGYVKEVERDMDIVRALFKEKERTMVDIGKNWYDLGWSYQMIKERDEAIRCFERATVLNPGFAMTWRNLGVLYRAKEDLFNAKHCYEAAVEANWNSDQYHKEKFAAELWRDLGKINEIIGDTARAERCRQQELTMRKAFKTVLEMERYAIEADQEAELGELSETITNDNQEYVRDRVVELLDSENCRNLKDVANLLKPEGINRFELQLYAKRKWREYIIEHVHYELPPQWWFAGYF